MRGNSTLHANHKCRWWVVKRSLFDVAQAARHQLQSSLIKESNCYKTISAIHGDTSCATNTELLLSLDVRNSLGWHSSTDRTGIFYLKPNPPVAAGYAKSHHAHSLVRASIHEIRRSAEHSCTAFLVVPARNCSNPTVPNSQVTEYSVTEPTSVHSSFGQLNSFSLKSETKSTLKINVFGKNY